MIVVNQSVAVCIPRQRCSPGRKHRSHPQSLAPPITSLECRQIHKKSEIQLSQYKALTKTNWHNQNVKHFLNIPKSKHIQTSACLDVYIIAHRSVRTPGVVPSFLLYQQCACSHVICLATSFGRGASRSLWAFSNNLHFVASALSALSTATPYFVEERHGYIVKSMETDYTSKKAPHFLTLQYQMQNQVSATNPSSQVIKLYQITISKKHVEHLDTCNAQVHTFPCGNAHGPDYSL